MLLNDPCQKLQREPPIKFVQLSQAHQFSASTQIKIVSWVATQSFLVVYLQFCKPFQICGTASHYNVWYAIQPSAWSKCFAPSHLLSPYPCLGPLWAFRVKSLPNFLLTIKTSTGSSGTISETTRFPGHIWKLAALFIYLKEVSQILLLDLDRSSPP